MPVRKSENMENEDLSLFIREGEGLTVEFKEKYSSKISNDIVAFANTKGGLIILGINDQGNIKGEKLTNKLKAEIINLANNCEPSIHIKKIKQVGEVVLIYIQEGDEKPYSCSSGYYRRLDAVTQKMTQREVRAIFRETTTISFEDISCKDLGVNGISLKKIKSFLREANTSYKVNKENLISFLSSLSIYKKGNINNAGALMFSSSVGRFIPHSEIIFGAFKGTDKANIYDRYNVKDDLVLQLNESVNFLKKHLNVRSEIRNFNRLDIYEIPLDALREAVVNAIVHRDYSITGTSIYIRIYDDRVEIENPGGLPAGITKRDFGKSSVRRNPIIADLFHRMGKVERMGSGIDRMRSAMREVGLKKPVFEIDSFFRVIFYREPYYSLKENRLYKVEKTGLKTRGKTGVKTRGKILQLIKENPEITIKELAELIGITSKGIEWHIKRLKVGNLIKYIGSAKSGHWEIIKP